MKKIFLLTLITLFLFVVSGCKNDKRIINLNDFTTIETTEHNDLINKIFNIQDQSNKDSYQFYYNLEYTKTLQNNIHKVIFNKTSLLTFDNVKPENTIGSHTEKMQYTLRRKDSNDLVIDLKMNGDGYLNNNKSYLITHGKERRYNGTKQQPLSYASDNDKYNYSTELALSINKELCLTLHRGFKSYHGTFFRDSKKQIILAMDANHLFSPVMYLPQSVFNEAREFKAYYIFNKQLTKLVAAECIISNVKFSKNDTEIHEFSLILRITESRKSPLKISNENINKCDKGKGFKDIFKYIPDEN